MGMVYRTDIRHAALNIPQALGLSVIVSLLTHQMMPECENSEKSNSEKFTQAFVQSWLIPCVALAVGWIIKQYM